MVGVAIGEDRCNTPLSYVVCFGLRAGADLGGMMIVGLGGTGVLGCTRLALLACRALGDWLLL